MLRAVPWAPARRTPGPPSNCSSGMHFHVCQLLLYHVDVIRVHVEAQVVHVTGWGSCLLVFLVGKRVDDEGGRAPGRTGRGLMWQQAAATQCTAVLSGARMNEPIISVCVTSPRKALCTRWGEQQAAACTSSDLLLACHACVSRMSTCQIMLPNFRSCAC